MTPIHLEKLILSDVYGYPVWVYANIGTVNNHVWTFTYSLAVHIAAGTFGYVYTLLALHPLPCWLVQMLCWLLYLTRIDGWCSLPISISSLSISKLAYLRWPKSNDQHQE